MLAAAMVMPDARLDRLLDSYHGTWHGRAIALAGLETVLGIGCEDEFGEGTQFLKWCQAPHSQKDVIGAIRAALILVSNRLARKKEEEDEAAIQAKRDRILRSARQPPKW